MLIQYKITRVIASHWEISVSIFVQLYVSQFFSINTHTLCCGFHEHLFVSVQCNSRRNDRVVEWFLQQLFAKYERRPFPLLTVFYGCKVFGWVQMLLASDCNQGMRAT